MVWCEGLVLSAAPAPLVGVFIPVLASAPDLRLLLHWPLRLAAASFRFGFGFVPLLLASLVLGVALAPSFGDAVGF